MVDEGRYEADEVRFLDVVADGDHDWLRSRGVERSFAAGSALFLEHEPSDRVMILLAGRVKVASASEDGRERVLAFRGPGEVLGELSAIDGQPRSASVHAVDDARALVLPSGDFRDLLERRPRLALFLLEKLIARLREADRKRVEFGASDTTGRVAARLLELANRYGRVTPDGIRIDLPITQEELASWVGSSREGANKALRTLEELGWIDVQRRSMTVVDSEALARRAV